MTCDPKIKAPASRLNYEIDYTQFLGDDEIATSTWEVDPAGLVIDQDSIDGDLKKTIVYIKGGLINQDYMLTNKIVTTGNLKMQDTIPILIRNT